MLGKISKILLNIEILLYCSRSYSRFFCPFHYHEDFYIVRYHSFVFFSLFFTEMIHFRSLFWGIPLLFWISSWQIFGHFYVGKKFIKKNDSKNVLGLFVWLVSLIAYSLKLYLKFNFELILFENIQGWII